jgi:hypothetical protein
MPDQTLCIDHGSKEIPVGVRVEVIE